MRDLKQFSGAREEVLEDWAEGEAREEVQGAHQQDRAQDQNDKGATGDREGSGAVR